MAIWKNTKYKKKTPQKGSPLGAKYRGLSEVPSRRANFDKTRQITLLDDLPGGGGPPYMKKYKILCGNTPKKYSFKKKTVGLWGGVMGCGGG